LVNRDGDIAAFGSGVFGRWGRDAEGRACYHYNPPPERDAPHEDHWHLVGNARISATCHNGGHVQIYDWSRGPKILNRWHPESGNFAGGFVCLRVHGATFPTLKAMLPQGAVMERIFGQGYFTKRTRWRGLLVEETIRAPAGSSAMLRMETVLANEGDAPLEVTFAPCWQYNLHQLMVAPIMANGWDRAVECFRARLNMAYRYRVDLSDATLTSEVHVSRRGLWRGRATAAALLDHHPGSFAFVDLSGTERGWRGLSDCFAEDFPEATDLYGAQAGWRRATGRGPLLASIRRLTLPPGARESFAAELRLSPASARAAQAAAPAPAPEEAAHEAPALAAYFPEAPWLARELEWHACYLQAASVYSEYFGAHYVDQGSAYAFLQGLSGAPRDYALFVLPLVYIRPDLAKETLRFLLRTQRYRDGAFPYAIFGHGKASGGGVHSRSSDLDLFVFWALAEYLNVTRDFAFLQELQPWYPRERGRRGSVLEHLRAAWRHLTGKIGLGPHGLIRCGTGDWNDVLIAFAKSGPITVWRGESSLNAGLAAAVLPSMADAVQEADPALAKDMRALAARQAETLRQMWTGQWVARGYTGWRDAMLGVDRIFLDTQAFGVLGGVWSASQRETLFGNIQRICVDPQPAGALALYPPMEGAMLEPGSDTNGGTWAAVDGWTTWAWMLHDPAAAWRFFLRTTMAARAEAYPENWYGIWSGPDSFNAHYHPKPAATFNLNATPMTLFPVMNQNRHAMPLLNAIKFAGFGADSGRIVFAPRTPFSSFALETTLMGCTWEAREASGYYVALQDGEYVMEIRPPEGWGAIADCEISPPPVRVEGLVFTVRAARGQRIAWRLVRQCAP
jgi:hypothetical protein